MSGGGEEVDAAVDPAVWYPPLPVDMQLFSQVFLILLVDMLHYGLPAGERSRGDSVTKATFTLCPRDTCNQML